VLICTGSGRLLLLLSYSLDGSWKPGPLVVRWPDGLQGGQEPYNVVRSDKGSSEYHLNKRHNSMAQQALYSAQGKVNSC
jgi:hypothetical protein